ncbi:pectinesterase QRT1-like [Silene latifolia]|uniref:pectinesterase QRT1-like n=1 Tax=Silene latifolia TaxID=37657 RepID=UPI003D783EF2
MVLVASPPTFTFTIRDLRQRVVVPSSKLYISFIGMANQSANNVITWNSKASDRTSNGEELGIFRSATITIFSEYFCASEITFQNTVVAIPGWLRRVSDLAMVFR